MNKTKTFERKYIRLTIIYSRGQNVWCHTLPHSIGNSAYIVSCPNRLIGEKEKAHEKEECSRSSREKFRS